jgi:hypothetical protein
MRTRRERSTRLQDSVGEEIPHSSVGKQHIDTHSLLTAFVPCALLEGELMVYSIMPLDCAVL